MTKPSIVNPKQIAKLAGKDAWYPYYAGFSSDFARTALLRHPPLEGKPVLDQWNGGGTTTQISDQLGLSSIGCDINPAMIVVSKARRLQMTIQESIEPLAKQLAKARSKKGEVRSRSPDPLTAWLSPTSVASIRSLERSIRDHFIPRTCSSNIVEAVCSSQFSDLAAYFYLILFRTVRHLLQPFHTANPTWLRVPQVRQRLRPSPTVIEHLFLTAVRETLSDVDSTVAVGTNTKSISLLLLGDSRSLPVHDNTVGAILTSPPYLTRLDYAVSTGPELAILGQGPAELRMLRERMIGTTVIAKNREPSKRLGEYADWCLDRIKKHSSKASHSYYWKNIFQYLDAMKASTAEAARVLAPGAPMSFVVQDSYYKDIHLDLPRIVREFAEECELQLIESHLFPVDRHLGRVHPTHRKHCGTLSRVESVVVMRKKPLLQEIAHVN